MITQRVHSRTCLTIGAMSLLLPATALFSDLQSLKDSITYYQGCESLKPSYEGENVHPNPQLQPGKIGKAFQFEQRWALNLILDPDFKGDVRDAWIPIGAPVFSKEGGFADPACVSVDATNYLRQVISNLEEGKRYCLSVYAKSSDGGALEMAVKCGGNSERFQSQALTSEYARFKLSFVAGGTTATVTIKGQSDKKASVDAVQLEGGKSFPRSFLPETGKPLGTEWVDIPAKPEIFNPMKGSIVFWTKPEWLGEESAGGLGFFSASASEPGTSWAKMTNTISIGAYRHPGKIGWENGMSMNLKDKAAGIYGYTPINFDEAKLMPGDWFHVVFTWEIKTGDDSLATCYLNGEKAGEMRFRSQEIEAPKAITLGYVGGAYADGLVDEFYIINRQVSADEAMEVYRLTTSLK